jgi:hypothetical protein
MGAMYEAVCLDCSHAFRAHHGGGFSFFDLHCKVCGRHEMVGHDRIPRALEQYLRAVREALDAAGEPPEKRQAVVKAADDFDQAIRPIVGPCPCGGQFGLHALVRCPACKSSNIKKKADTGVLYD